jgi:integrase
MATVFKRDSSPFWFACFASHQGKTIRRSTKSADKATALRMALEWERVEREAQAGHATVAAFQKVVSEVSNRVIGETLPSRTVRQYFAQWMTAQERNVTPASLERYRHAVARFVESLGPVADQPIRAVQPRHIEQFKLDRLRLGRAPKTVIVDIKIVGIALKQAFDFGEIDRNPVPAVRLPKPASIRREPFSMTEVFQLADAAPNDDWETLILLGFFTGARLGDCVRMTWDNVDERHQAIVYTQRKTGRTVVVPVHPDLLSHLRHISRQGTIGPLCGSLAARAQPGRSGLSAKFKEIVKRAGLDLMTVQGKGSQKFARRTFHSLRHTTASQLSDGGIAEDLRMAITGHASREMHQLYTHPAYESLKRAILSIPTRESLGLARKVLHVPDGQSRVTLGKV